MAALSNADDKFELRVEEEAADSYSHLRTHLGGKEREREDGRGSARRLVLDRMVRLVLFEGAPSVAQCYSSLDSATTATGSWDTFTVELSPPPSPHQSTPTSPPRHSFKDAAPASQPPAKRRRPSPVLDGNPWDVTGSQFQDADESGAAPSRPANAAVSSSDSEPDSLEVARRRARRRSSSSPEIQALKQEDEDEGASKISALHLPLDHGKTQLTAHTQTGFMMPPPTQSRAGHSAVFRAEQSQPAVQPPHDVSFPSPPSAPLPDVSRNISDYTADDSYDATYADGVSLGAPPHLPWKVYHLTPLNELRKKLLNARGAPPPRVSVLATVNSFEQRDTANGKALTEVTLIDDSGQHAKLVLWGAAGIEIAKFIRRADIIYVDSAPSPLPNSILRSFPRD